MVVLVDRSIRLEPLWMQLLNSIQLTHLSMSEGKPFATPLSIERHDTFGNMTHRWNMDGRYSVPRLVGGEAV